MATSKKNKKEEDIEKDVKSNFDVNLALQQLKLPDMFKAGLNYYITINKLTPNSQKEFDKIVKDYGELKL